MQSMLLAPASAAFLGAGTASPALSSRAAVRMDLAKGTLNVGVVGAGRIGLVHLEALAATAEAKPIIISNPTVSKAEVRAPACCVRPDPSSAYRLPTSEPALTMPPCRPLPPTTLAWSSPRATATYAAAQPYSLRYCSATA